MNYTFANWLASASRGDRYRYYRGFLLRDWDRGSGRPYDLRVAKAVTSAWNAYETGRATLVQERKGDNDYIYFAVRL